MKADGNAVCEAYARYNKLLLEIQTLLFADSPQHPLYLHSKIVPYHEKGCGLIDLDCEVKCYEDLAELLSMYLQYCALRQGRP